jgi:uncharacterized repeat protein (TIGR01451 family)
MSSRFRFSRLRRPDGDRAEPSSNRSLRRYLGAALALTTLFGVLPVEWAAADGNDFSLDFEAAAPALYDHASGLTGGAHADSVEQLQGGDFNCGDKVAFLAFIDVDAGAPAQTLELTFNFDTQPNAADGVGFRSFVSAGPNPGDPAHTADGGSVVSVTENTFSVNPLPDPAVLGVEITDLAGDETFVLRIVVELGCDAGSSPNGNLTARIDAAEVTAPAAEADEFSVGAQTVPLMSAADILVPQIDITKTADAASASAGDTIGFTIGVTNPGDGAATTVQVTDDLPSNPGLDWSIDPAVTGCSITGALLDEQLVCNFGTLNAGASTTPVHVTSDTTADTCGIVNNTAAVTTANDGTDQASASVEVLCPDVAVTKTATPELVTGGSTATFTILVSNLGVGDATNVHLEDTLPAGSWTEDSTSCEINAGVLTCDFPTLAAGASAPLITLTRPTTGNTCETLPNTAGVSAANEPQTALGNNQSSATITVTCAALSIAKAADASPVSAGDQVGFTVTVFNGGDAPATDVAVTDELPGNLGLDWTLSPAVTGCAITGAVGEQVLNCTLPTVLSGGSVQIHVVSSTTPATCGLIENRAVLATGDPVLASVTVNCPDVQVVKTADDSSISAGDSAAFTIEVTNLGPGTATGVTLNDTLPAGIAWSQDNGDCSIGGDTLSCVFGTLDVGETHIIHVTGDTDTDGADCGQIDNTANALSTNEPASVLANNTSTASIVVNCPDVEVDKTATDPIIEAGEDAGFEIVVTNNGPGTATDVTLTDTLPPGITWTEDSPFCTITGNVLSCSFGDMPVGESHTINLTGTTDAADCGSIANTSIIAAVNEAAGADGNNSATATIKIVCPVYGSDPDTLPTEQPYEPAPGDQPEVGGVDETSGDPGAGTAGTTVPVTPVPESGNEVVDAVIDVVQSPLTLPRTGGELIQQAVAGLGLIGLGLVLMAVRRRRSSSATA